MAAVSSHGRLRFVPALPVQLRPAVEALFFFNARQSIVQDGIRWSVEEFGIPEMLELDGMIWIGVKSGTTQCLFACDEGGEDAIVAGVVLYARPSTELVAITHLAVDPEYTAIGPHGLGLILVDQVRQVARRMKGVIRLQLPYRPSHYLPVS